MCGYTWENTKVFGGLHSHSGRWLQGYKLLYFNIYHFTLGAVKRHVYLLPFPLTFSEENNCLYRMKKWAVNKSSWSKLDSLSNAMFCVLYQQRMAFRVFHSKFHRVILRITSSIWSLYPLVHYWTGTCNKLSVGIYFPPAHILGLYRK